MPRYASHVNPASIPGTPEAWTRLLLRCGVAAGPVFVAAFLLEGAVRDGYRPLRHPVSSLALGPRGSVQAGNFAVAGTLFLAGAAGLARAGEPAAGNWAVPALIGAAGAGLIAAAVFTTDPVSGYPPGTPDALTQPSRTGIAHNLSAVPVFVGLPAAALELWLAVLADWPAPLRRVQRRQRRHHARDHGPGRCRLRPIAPARQRRRPSPAHQHRHRLRLANSHVCASTPAHARYRGGAPAGISDRASLVIGSDVMGSTANRQRRALRRWARGPR